MKQYWTPDLLLNCISKWEKEEINLLSVEMKKNHFIYNLTFISFDFQLSSAFLIHFLKYASNLESLQLWSHNIQYASHRLVTGTILNAVINDLDNANIKLELETLDIHGIDLNDIDGTLLGKLFKIAPKLKCLYVSECRLSGCTLGAMITECQNSEDTVCNSHKLVTGAIHNAVINDLDNANIKLGLETLYISGNDLNDIDGTLLGKLFKIAPKLKCLAVWECRLSGGTLGAMITECQNSEDTVCNSHKLVTGAIHNAVINDLDNANIKLELEKLDISGNDLNDIDGTLLGKLFKLAPKLKCLDVSKCKLSGGTLSAMITECQNSEDTVDHVLKRYRLVLKGNGLSDIDGTSVADLVRVHCHYKFGDDDYDDTIFILCDYSLTFDNIEKLVESVGENITLDWESIDLSRINLSSISGITLARLFKICPVLDHIDMSYCSLSLSIVNEMVEECCRMNANIKLELKKLDISGNDLNDIDGTLLGKLFKIAPKLKYLNLRKCRLSGGTLRAMIRECQNSEDTVDHVLKHYRFVLEDKDLSDSDDTSVADLVRVDCHYEFGDYYDDYDGYDDDTIFILSDYSLTFDNIEKLVESVGENITLHWYRINLNRINLSSISGITLARLFKICPDLKHIDMSYCSLSGRIVNEMIEECCRMNVVFNDNMLSLKGNDLSDIDGKSLAELVRVVGKFYYEDGIFSWSDYSLTAGNLEMLVESVGENIILNWDSIHLSGINLSSISGKTLASLFKICPVLKDIDMSNCSLSGSIVNEMMKECCRMNVVLKDNMLSLKGNDLSDIDGKSLAELVRVICLHYETFSWSDYSLTAGNLEMLVESVGENITFNWVMINLSGINLSSISGKILAHLFKISPDLNHIDMSNCSLSGRIVNEMMEECCRMNVVLKDNMLSLKGNDLSDIYGKSLAEFRLS
ncbi:uncharacterized protein LOC117121210 isoform X1 [Anneissia japonica]|uniref:uncharacterized protein LOC117121210 isoform X1 n=1 Tax=Anneissia japonica TaxID=1529436 RepID=UPI0014257A6E|nr:uncharacterized protein LOC117121210 isoform X1 [Anneissia japonica]